MKRYQTTAKYRRRNYRNSLRSAKRKFKSKIKKKWKRQSEHGKTVEQRKRAYTFANYTTIVAPKYFSFIEKPESTIRFLNKLEHCYLRRKCVFVDLETIEYLDHSAVSVLISVMFSFKSRNIAFNGNFPTKSELKEKLISSGFFKYLRKPIGDKIEYTIGQENQIFARANKEVNSELGLIVMAEASVTVWGDRRICKGLQRVLLELMQNTNNHAAISEKGAKHWWLSVNHNREEKRVSFYFVDYGVGIFESLKNKPAKNKWFNWYEKIKNKLKYGGDDEIFRLLLNGEMHMTVTGQHFRGKGLPGIKEVQDRNQISNLKIISNDVFADVNKFKYEKLSTSFSGTFVTWELTKDNSTLPWNI